MENAYLTWQRCFLKSVVKNTFFPYKSNRLPKYYSIIQFVMTHSSHFRISQLLKPNIKHLISHQKIIKPTSESKIFLRNMTLFLHCTLLPRFPLRHTTRSPNMLASACDRGHEPGNFGWARMTTTTENGRGPPFSAILGLVDGEFVQKWRITNLVFEIFVAGKNILP